MQFCIPSLNCIPSPSIGGMPSALPPLLEAFQGVHSSHWKAKLHLHFIVGLSLISA